MLLRRYYKKGEKYNNTISEEFFEKMVANNGLSFAMKKDNAYYEIVFENEKERDKFVNQTYENVIKNPRFYLDNLDSLPVYKRTNLAKNMKSPLFTPEGTRYTKKDN